MWFGASIEALGKTNALEILNNKALAYAADESACIQSIDWMYGDGLSSVKIDLWPFADYNYAVVGKTGYEEVVK